MFTRDQYSRKAVRDVRNAAAVVLARHLGGLSFELGGQSFSFTKVFDEWPSYAQRYKPPAACVLPAGWSYGPWGLTPTLLEDTWEPKGQQGFGLYKTAELECEMEISIRTTSTAERETITLGVEDAFQADQMLMSQKAGPRNSVILFMPEYYNLPARFSLLKGRTIDDEDRAMREKRDVILTIGVQASKVKLGPVYPMALHFKKQADGTIFTPSTNS